MSVLSIISHLQDKVKKIEASILSTAQNHQGLIGMLQGTKEALDEALKFVEPAPLSGAENVANVEHE